MNLEWDGENNMKYAIGIDIGGTKIAAAIVDEERNIHFREEVPSDPSSSLMMFQQVVNCVDKILDKSKMSIHQIEGFGVGVPGKVDRENGIAIYQNNLPWSNFPVAKQLIDHYQIEKVIVDNDVYMATFSEWIHFGKNNSETFVYITVSTGISCAIINKGSFVRGVGFAGEIGLLPSPKGNTTSFQRIESIASGPAIQKAFNDKELNTKEILERYQSGDKTFEPIINDITESLSYACYVISCLLDPDKMVFGGGVINNQPYLLDIIRRKVKQYITIEQNHILQNIYLSKSKGDAGIIGAAIRVFHTL